MNRMRKAALLERRRGRRRRLRDAARALPVFGTLLLLLGPLVWTRDAEGGVPTVGVFLYVFGVWAALIAAAALMSGPLRRAEDPPTSRTGDSSDREKARR